MNNYKLKVQYDGGRYRGWQRLGNGGNTIQGKIEEVLSKLVGEEIKINGCSRTDSGVHALAQIANFKSNKKFTEVEVKKYLNKYLPQDISITEVRLVAESFHPRYNAKEKTYLYKIWNKEYTNPFMRKYSMHIDRKLDIKRMETASRFFVGEHDFTAFSNAKSKKKSKVREIYSINIEENQGFVEIRVRGNGFLYNMVRKIVGALIKVGLYEMGPEDILKIIDSKERKHVGIMAEACGLYLEKIKF
ncbi:tRNA pseudouridine(38-40) synthase TruA [Dethiothermospora halolimnae]|uniref:tRNA pseudouridine(38-40) synthase TruA n=1 Tax=Dethiothermospora halolimnae TaxID=3114390 RepID=UPI003CCBC20B